MAAAGKGFSLDLTWTPSSAQSAKTMLPHVFLIVM